MTNNNQGEKPREWWIPEGSWATVRRGVQFIAYDFNPNSAKDFHVIEKSYADALQSQLKLAQDENAARDKTIVALATALEFECGNKCAEGINPCNAREFLTKHAEIIKQARGKS
jgi:hypothetical protein